MLSSFNTCGGTDPYELKVNIIRDASFIYKLDIVSNLLTLTIL